ncbi:hypothetical protein AS593_00790 [Caulobacter vibrioides]|nr:hypothetical protein AS593_00790 [Caulobacter vibrioides]
MRGSRILVGLLVVAGLAIAAVFAYDAARPRVHPIKAADAARNGVDLSSAAPAAAQPAQGPDGRAELFGPARVIDGDTLEIQGLRARLWTIDAPEPDQTCLDRDGASFACGQASREHLEKLIAGRKVACRPEGPPSDGDAWQGLCFVADAPCADAAAPCASDLSSLNLAMVRHGWAIDLEGQYADPESDAEADKAGLWAGRFDEPQAWRARVKRTAP